MMNGYITEELIENTYLFCRSRIYDSESAKDISQDILYEALKAIDKNKEFHSFYSWYWKMARNKVARYIASKSDPAIPLDSAEGIMSDHIQPIESLIGREELNELNHSLSRLADIHREVIINYYLKEHSISQIACELDIPEGRVKSRLFEARKNLKERITNMNNIGRSAYAPADVNYFLGFNCGEASQIMQGKIAQQTVVICRSDPKTVYEIADELGIAPVYLEEILEKMTNALLLTKSSQGKYLTNFCVFPGQAYINAQYEAYAVRIYNNYPERISKALWELKDKIAALNFYGNDFNYNYLMWFLYVLAGYSIAETSDKIYSAKYNSKYPDEPERSYRITAHFTPPDETLDYSMYRGDWHGMNWSNSHAVYRTANFGRLEYINDFDCTPFPSQFPDNDTLSRNDWVDGNNISLLIQLAKAPDKFLNKYEEEQAADFIKKGLITKTDKGLKVNLPIMSRSVYEKIKAMIDEVLKPIAEEYEEAITNKVETLLLRYVRKDLMSNFIHWDMKMFLQPICESFWYGLNASVYLEKTEDYTHSAAALWIITE